MVTPVVTATIDFHGTSAEKKLAASVFRAFDQQGRFMSIDAPIRLPLDVVVEFVNQGEASVEARKVENAIAANDHVFVLERTDEAVVVISTRLGRPPMDEIIPFSHSFTKRFITPQPKPETPVMPVRARVRMAPSWAVPDALAALSERMDASDDAIELTEDETPLSVEIFSPERPVVVEEADAPVIVEAEPDDVNVEAPAARTITVPVIPSVDVSIVDDVELAEAIRERLRADIRVANFGDHWMAEDQVPRFSRGDLRRIKDYIQEQEQPLTDDVLVQDVLMVRPNSNDFELMRFAVNFRLSREHRDFDFVGTNNQRFWSTSSLPQIGTTRRKPNEIGTDFRYLVEETTAAPEYRASKSVDHVLTFYEYYHGLLPYDAEMQRLLPAPLQPEQRSVVLTFETPQSYTTYLVELRYPTPNRGGFILGLDDFYTENLVPGAMLSLQRTDNDGHYLVEYLPAGNQSARLLELDERRAVRYVFRPTTYACAVDDALLLTEDRFPRLGSEKPLDDRSRRRPESVVAATFERIGDQSDVPGYSATFTDLFAAVNVERPFAAKVLRSILEDDETGAFAHDPERDDVYTYVPVTTG